MTTTGHWPGCIGTKRSLPNQSLKEPSAGYAAFARAAVIRSLSPLLAGQDVLVESAGALVLARSAGSPADAPPARPLRSGSLRARARWQNSGRISIFKS